MTKYWYGQTLANLATRGPEDGPPTAADDPFRLTLEGVNTDARANAARYGWTPGQTITNKRTANTVANFLVIILVGGYVQSQLNGNYAFVENWGKTTSYGYYPPNRGFSGMPSRETLNPGTIVDRYGGTGGTFASPQGTPPEARSLPYGWESNPYNAYKVVKPLEVDAGPAAPWFGQPGGGIQYDFGRSIQELLDLGYLEPF